MEFSLSQNIKLATSEFHGSQLMSSKKKAVAGERHLPPGLPPDLRGGGNLFVPEPGARFPAHSAASNSAAQRPLPQSASHLSQIPHTVSRSAAHQSHPPEFESGPDYDATASDVRYRSNFPSDHPEFDRSNPRLSRKREKSAERVDRSIRKSDSAYCLPLCSSSILPKGV